MGPKMKAVKKIAVKGSAKLRGAVPGDRDAGLEFSSVKDVTKYFDRNPDRLVDYVESSRRVRAGIPGLHVNQLLKKVGLPFVLDGELFEKVPEEALVNPATLCRFGDFGKVLAQARTMFPSPF